MKLKIILLGFMLPCITLATQDADRTVGRFGVQGNNAYFSVMEGFSLNCQFEIVYLDISTNFGRVAYSSILAAKMSGKKLSRITYDQASLGGLCTLSLVEIDD